MIKLLVLSPFLLATPRWCLHVYRLEVFSRLTAGPHPMVLVPRALVSFSFPWRLLPFLFKVFSRITVGLHLILLMPKLALRVLIVYSLSWRWFLCLHRKLARLEHIIKFPQQSLSYRAFMMDISPPLCMHRWTSKSRSFCCVQGAKTLCHLKWIRSLNCGR